VSLLEVEKEDKTLRILTNFWSLAAITLFVLDFIQKGRIEALSSTIGVLYLLILGYYTGTKEFCRWQDYHDSKHHIGELFVGVWTLLVVGLMVFSFINPSYHVSGALIALYTTIVGIFALTQHSKTLFKEAHKKQRN
jgi:tellurite resistance protein TehA-like permease